MSAWNRTVFENKLCHTHRKWIFQKHKNNEYSHVLINFKIMFLGFIFMWICKLTDLKLKLPNQKFPRIMIIPPYIATEQEAFFRFSFLSLWKWRGMERKNLFIFIYIFRVKNYSVATRCHCHRGWFYSTEKKSIYFIYIETKLWTKIFSQQNKTDLRTINIVLCILYIFIKCFYLYTGETLIMYIRGCFVF